MRIGVLVISGLAVMMGGLVACNPLAQNSGGSASKTEKTSSSELKSDVLKKIHGQWKIESSGVTVGFTDTGIFYSLEEKDGKLIPVERGSYRLDSTQNPMRLENTNNGEKRASLIEFLNSGEMRVLNLEPNKPLPMSIPENAERLKKISDVATVLGMLPLPKVSQQDIAMQRAKTMQSESKTIVASMARSAQSYFIDTAQLPTAFSQLNLGIDSESKIISIRLNQSKVLVHRC